MFSCRLRQRKLGSSGSELCPRACGDQVGGRARVAEPKGRAVSRNGSTRWTPTFSFGHFPARDAAGDLRCSLPREAYGVRGYRAANPSVGTVTRRQISLRARPACFRRTEKRFSSAPGPTSETRSTAMPVGFGEALAKKFSADCGTLQPPRESRKKPLFKAT